MIYGQGFSINTKLSRAWVWKLKPEWEDDSSRKIFSSGEGRT